MAAMIRTLLGDAAVNPRGEEALLDPDTAPLSPDYYRHALTVIERQLGSGDVGPADESGHAGETAEAGS
jgi:hypothetical protein